MVELDDLADEHGDLRPGVLEELARGQQRAAQARAVPGAVEQRREPVRHAAPLRPAAAAGRRGEQPQVVRPAAGRRVEQQPRIVQLPAIMFGPQRVTIPGPIAGVLLVLFGVLVGLHFGRATEPVLATGSLVSERAAAAPSQTSASGEEPSYSPRPPQPADPLSFVSPTPQPTAQITGTRVRLRTGPSLSAAIRSAFDDGASVRVLGETNGWCRVATDSGVEGYVFGSYVRGSAGRECRPGVTLKRLVGAGVDLPAGEKVLVSGQPTTDAVTLLLPNQTRVRVPSHAIATDGVNR